MIAYSPLNRRKHAELAGELSNLYRKEEKLLSEVGICRFKNLISFISNCSLCTICKSIQLLVCQNK